MASASVKESKLVMAKTPSQVVGNVNDLGPRVRQISKVDELNELLSNAMRKVVLVEFFAEWCGPCKLIATKLEEWAEKYDIFIVKVDVDEFEDLATEYNVGGIPTFVILRDNHKLEQLEGSNQEKLILTLEKHCKNADSKLGNVVPSTVTQKQAN